MDFDRELVVRAKTGDRSACEAIVEQFSPMVFRLISRFFRSREDVEDLAQDVFLKVFARIDQVRPDEAEGSIGVIRHDWGRTAAMPLAPHA